MLPGEEAKVVPGSQGVQEVTPLSEEVPIRHKLQLLVLPVAAEYLPASQFVHAAFWEFEPILEPQLPGGQEKGQAAA